MMRETTKAFGLTSLLGTAVFAYQILTVSKPRLERMTFKSASLAQQALDGIQQTPQAMTWLALYTALGIVTHVAPLWLVVRVSTDLRKAGPRWMQVQLARRYAMPTLIAAALLTMAISNRLLFPASMAFPDSDLIVTQVASPLLIWGLAAGFGGLFLTWLWKGASHTSRLLTFLACASVAGGHALQARQPDARVSGPLPNVIVIGIDSLRPDHLRAFGFPGESVTPNLDLLIQPSIKFSDAYTTQARTFVAYVSILTGLYPVHHGVRENLYPRELFRLGPTLPQQLKEHGYSTLFSMDEVRFANIDPSFGFDQVASPSIGAMDFLIGSVLDTTGTNLAQLLPYSYAFMPHVAGNRAASGTYLPSVHNARLRGALRSMPSDRPILGMFHFCAAHVPFFYDGKKEPPAPAPFNDSPNKYRRALRVADSQVGELVRFLRASGRLRNAIVVVLSDHGEALGMKKDDKELVTTDGNTMTIRYHGHGSPAFDRSQAHVVLSFQRYIDGTPQWPEKEVDTAVSLVDVAPTIMALLGLPTPPGAIDGTPLVSQAGTNQAPRGRTIFIESGISGNSLQKRIVDDQEVANEFSYLYQVTPDLRYELIPGEIPEQLRSKQRAALHNGTWLSSAPERPLGLVSADCWVVIEPGESRSRCESKRALSRNVHALSRSLCNHYSRDTDFFTGWCPPTSPSGTTLPALE